MAGALTRIKARAVCALNAVRAVTVPRTWRFAQDALHARVSGAPRKLTVQ